MTCIRVILRKTVARVVDDVGNPIDVVGVLKNCVLALVSSRFPTRHTYNVRHQKNIHLLHVEGKEIASGGKDDVIKLWNYLVISFLTSPNLFRMEHVLERFQDTKRL